MNIVHNADESESREKIRQERSTIVSSQGSGYALPIMSYCTVCTYGWSSETC